MGANGERQLMSFGAYAKYRGCSKAAVSKAYKRDRLKLSVTLDAAGQPKINDVDLADREWAQNTDQSRTSAPAATKTSAPPPAMPPIAATAAAQQPLRDAAPGDPAPALDPEDRWSVTDATAEERKWKALLAEIRYKQELGELIPAKDVEAAQAALFTIIRTKLLGVPGKARSNAPHLTLGDVALIDRLIRETLEELAATEPPAPPDAAAGADDGSSSGAAA